MEAMRRRSTSRLFTYLIPGLLAGLLPFPIELLSQYPFASLSMPPSLWLYAFCLRLVGNPAAAEGCPACNDDVKDWLIIHCEFQWQNALLCQRILYQDWQISKRHVEPQAAFSLEQHSAGETN